MNKRQLLTNLEVLKNLKPKADLPFLEQTQLLSEFDIIVLVLSDEVYMHRDHELYKRLFGTN